VFESCAILIYLAEKSGLFLPRDGHERIAVMEWTCPNSPDTLSFSNRVVDLNEICVNRPEN
jgi:glutathione S-transferase